MFNFLKSESSEVHLIYFSQSKSQIFKIPGERFFRLSRKGAGVVKSGGCFMSSWVGLNFIQSGSSVAVKCYWVPLKTRRRSGILSSSYFPPWSTWSVLWISFIFVPWLNILPSIWGRFWKFNLVLNVPVSL